MNKQIKQIIKKNIFPYLTDSIFSKIKNYHNIHKGESCYLFGDGTSVKYFDLKKFSDRITIPCNYIPFHKEFPCLQVPYVVMMAPFYFYPFYKNPYPPYQWFKFKIHQEYHNLIRSNRDIQFFLNITNYPAVRDKNVTYVYSSDWDKSLPENHIGRLNNCFVDSIRGMIFMAIYMGFSKVYLVGCDYTHSPSRSLHWYEKGTGVVTEMKGYNLDFFSQAKEYIDIVTVTLDSGSDVLESVTYQALTGAEPKFRENTELMDDKILKLLSQLPGWYNIY